MIGLVHRLPMKKLREFLTTSETIQPQKDQASQDYCAHIYLGNMYMALGRFDLAETEYLRAHAIRPSTETHLKLGTARTQLIGLRRISGRAISRNKSRAA